jgi:hypothetical protein
MIIIRPKDQSGERAVGNGNRRPRNVKARDRTMMNHPTHPEMDSGVSRDAEEPTLEKEA